MWDGVGRWLVRIVGERIECGVVKFKGDNINWRGEEEGSVCVEG